LIDFRYHVVSLVAVLLALATGILVGSSVVEGPLLDQLTKTTDQLRAHTDDLQQEISALERRRAFAQAAAQQLAPELVAGKLTGEKITLISLPGADPDIAEATTSMLEQAGGTVVSEVRVHPSYADAAQENVLDGLVNQLAPAGTSWPEDSGVYDRAGIELAGALVRPEFVVAGEPLPDSATQVLTGFESSEYIDVVGDPTGPATMAVLLAGPPTGTDGAAQRAAQAYVALARALDEHSRGVVVAGNEESASDSGTVAAVRANSSAANVVSTIDVADTPIGRIGVVFALDEQSRGDSGQYGISGTTDGPLPDLTKEGQQ